MAYLRRADALTLLVALCGLVLVCGCNNRSRGRPMTPTDASTDTRPTGDGGGTPDGDTRPDVSTPADSSTVDTARPDTSMGGEGDAAVAAYRELIVAQCAAAHRCRSSVMTYIPDATDADFVAAFGATESECLSLAYPVDGQMALRDAVNAGTILYDAGSTAACAAGYRTQTCESFWTDPISASCDAAVVGTLADGAGCTINGECVSSTCRDGVCATE